MNFNSIINKYTEYIGMTYDEKLHAGNLLAEPARDLLDMDKKALDNSSALQRNFFIRKIAGDLLRQVQNMGHTKRYDCVPILKEYTYLAFDLAFDYCEFEADRRLLPFLAQVIHYEKGNEDKKYFEKLEDLSNKSLILEKKHVERLSDPDNTVYVGDVWGF